MGRHVITQGEVICVVTGTSKITLLILQQLLILLRYFDKLKKTNFQRDRMEDAFSSLFYYTHQRKNVNLPSKQIPRHITILPDQPARITKLMPPTKRRTRLPPQEILDVMIHILDRFPIDSQELVFFCPVDTLKFKILVLTSFIHFLSSPSTERNCGWGDEKGKLPTFAEQSNNHTPEIINSSIPSCTMKRVAQTENRISCIHLTVGNFFLFRLANIIPNIRFWDHFCCSIFLCNFCNYRT